MERIDHEVAERSDYERVIRNLREYDREEVSRWGFSEMELISSFDKLTPWLVVKLNREPVAVYSHTLTSHLCHFEFLGTSAVDRRLMRLTRSARLYIDHVSAAQPFHRPVVFVWEGHHQSRDWLKYLGFLDTGNSVWRGENRFVVTERP